jgi:hypothetical protein
VRIGKKVNKSKVDLPTAFESLRILPLTVNLNEMNLVITGVGPNTDGKNHAQALASLK